MRITLLSLVAVVSLALAGCGKKLDTGGVEKTVKDQITEMGLEVDKVKCPGDVKAEAGKTFECTVTKGDKSAKVTIKMEKVEGDKVHYTTDYTALGELMGEGGGGGEEKEEGGEKTE
jgi:hypothetical protein